MDAATNESIPYRAARELVDPRVGDYIQAIRERARHGRIRLLELGAGSGAIAFAAAREGFAEHVSVWEPDELLASLIREAASTGGPVHLLEGETVRAAVPPGAKFDVIVVNMPAPLFYGQPTVALVRQAASLLGSSGSFLPVVARHEVRLSTSDVGDYVATDSVVEVRASLVAGGGLSPWVVLGTDTYGPSLRGSGSWVGHALTTSAGRISSLELRTLDFLSESTTPRASSSLICPLSAVREVSSGTSVALRVVWDFDSVRGDHTCRVMASIDPP